MRSPAAFVPAALLIAGCAFVLHTRGQEAIPLAHPLAGILADVPGYRFKDQTVSPEERRIAGMTDYVARTYRRDSTIAFTTLVSYYDRQTQGKTIHSPKNCLPGAGWEILRGGTATVVVNGVAHEVNRYVLKNGPAVAVAYYWYQGRGRIVANEYQVKWNLLRDAALSGHTEEALVRIVVPVTAKRGGVDLGEDRTYAAAYATGETIARRLIVEVDRVLPSAARTATVRGETHVASR